MIYIIINIHNYIKCYINMFSRLKELSQKSSGKRIGQEVNI